MENLDLAALRIRERLLFRGRNEWELGGNWIVATITVKVATIFEEIATILEKVATINTKVATIENLERNGPIE